MKKDMKWAMNHLPKSDDKNLPIMSLSEVAKPGHSTRVSRNTAKRR